MNGHRNAPVLLFIAALAAAGTLGADWVGSDYPFALEIPDGARAGGNDGLNLSELPQVPEPGCSAHMEEGAPLGPARLDVLVRNEGRLRVVGSFRYEGRVPCPVVGNGASTVVVRFPGLPAHYGWAEALAPVADAPIKIRWLKTIHRAGDPSRATLAVFMESGNATHVASASVPFLPHRAAIACLLSDEGEQCEELDKDATTIRGGPVRSFRLIQLASAESAVHVKTFGGSVVQARDVPVDVIRAGSFAAISPRDRPDWQDLLVEATGPNGCRTWISGSAIPRPAAVTRLQFPSSCGVVIRPRFVSSVPVTFDKESRLIVLSDETEGLGGIALMVLDVDDEGLFHADSLPSGRYRFLLFASMSRHEPVSAAVESGPVNDVTFPVGRLLRGRVIDENGLSPRSPASVQLFPLAHSRDVSAAQSPKNSSEDPLKDAATVSTDDEGRFLIAASRTGRHTLFAFRGNRRASRVVEVKQDSGVADVGELRLDVGGRIRGRLEGCEVQGELILAQLPDLSKALSAGPLEVFRVPVGPDGAFVAEGLPGGFAFVAATCGGKLQDLSPSMVEVPSEGETFVVLSTGATRPQ